MAQICRLLWSQYRHMPFMKSGPKTSMLKYRVGFKVVSKLDLINAENGNKSKG